MEKSIFKFTDFRKAQVFNFFRYISDALIFVFLPLFFSSLQLSSFETGTLLASVPIMAIVGNVVMSLLAKSAKRNILLIQIIMPFEIVSACMIGFFSNFYIVLIISIIMNFCNSSFYSLLDGVCSQIASSAKKNYVAIRVFGSIAYLISSLFSGFLIDAINYKFTFLLAGIIWLLDYILLYFIKVDNEEDKKENDSNLTSNPFKSKAFIAYTIFYIFSISASHACDTFFSVYAKNIREVNASVYGILYSTMILTEIIVMIVTIFVKFKKQYLMLLFSAIFLFLRVFLLCFELPKTILYIVPSLRGIGWGLLLAYHINTLKKFLNSKQLVKAIFVLTIGLHIIVAIIDQFGPHIVELTDSYQILFIILTCISAVGLFAISFINIFNLVKKNNK